MPNNSTSAFALAASLRGRGDEELLALIEEREVREAGVNDFFDLAERLLDKQSIQSALSRLDRRALLTLAVVCELGAAGSVVTRDALIERTREIDHPDSLAFPSTIDSRVTRLHQTGLLVVAPEGYVALEPVCEVLAAWPSTKLPSIAELAVPLPESLGEAGRVHDGKTNALAAERAFTTLMAIDELLAELAREGVRELARGGFGAPDVKRLTSVTGLKADDVDRVVRMLRSARLITDASGRWRPTEDAAAWSVGSLADRWERLATAWAATMPDDMRFVLADRAHAVWGDQFEEFLSWLYPAADDAFRERIDQQIAAAELLGITANHEPSAAGSALLSRGAEAGRAAMAELFPPEVESVYVQQDLTIVSPGPLAPTVDARLRTMATVESRALASTFRVSLESISRALAGGETEESLLEFLRGISLTGIPQPLGYLITETAARFGMIRVGAVTELPDVRRVSYVATSDPQLLETVLVDRRLTPLGLVRESEHRATSRFDRDVLYFALLDARYPAAAVDNDDEIIVPSRHQLARASEAANRKPHRDLAGEMLARLRASSTATEAETSSAWLERQVEIAIRSRLTVTVTVSMPDGTEQDFVLEPTGLANGRLRARDRKADIERTLPLSRIVRIAGEGES